MVSAANRKPDDLKDGNLTVRLREFFPGDPFKNLVPAYLFDMLSPAGERMGNIDLRLGDTNFLIMYAGQFAYGVDPQFRGHHFAARSCRLILPLARAHGMDPVWITCNPDNLASRRACE